MVDVNPDSVTLFFRNPDNIHRLKMSQLIKLTELQLRIDELNAQNLNDFNMANRDIQVGRLRDGMVEIVESAMVDGRIVDRSPARADSRPVILHYMTGKDGHYSS